MVSGHKKKRNKKNKANLSNHVDQKEDNPVSKEETDEDLNESVDDDLVQEPIKRNHSEDDSDAEEEPKKKKKKKQPVPTDSTDNKKDKKSIRQMKREKHAQRQAEEAATAKDKNKSQCITYLSQWKHDRQNWKFMKARQVWLYKNKFSAYLLPDSSWPVFLEYFESAKGNIRNMLLEDANKVIKQMDEWTESQSNTKQSAKRNEENADDEKDDKKEEPKQPDDIAYKRARDLIQCLQE